MKYDYIIAGAGCAGLSLLYRILRDPVLCKKKILLVDKERKTKNDRTWCYWETGEGIFESIVRHQWDILEFKTELFTREFELKDYKYKMISGIDFYNYVFELVKNFNNVHFKAEETLTFDVENDLACLKTNGGTYLSDYIFNSTGLMNPKISKENTLLQHFMGWKIETEHPAFNDKVGTLMDFSVDQKHGTTFMYVLPTSTTCALVEYTLFTSDLLEKEDYRKELEQYICNKLSVKNYQVIEEEFGVIPMTLQKFNTHYKNKIINIGTAGGHTKASSGYTFQFVQKHANKIVERLKNKQNPLVKFTFRDRVFQWYDRTLIEVIISNRMTGKDVFTNIFKKLSPDRILKFLGNESNIVDDITIMRSLPTTKFLPVGIKQMLRK